MRCLLLSSMGLAVFMTRSSQWRCGLKLFIGGLMLAATSIKARDCWTKSYAARLMRSVLNPEMKMSKLAKKIASRPWIRRSIDLAGMSLRVLVVDDNRDAAEALASYLSFESMECRIALGGLEAITIGLAWTPHVILMDISMPECNGFDATLALRKDQRTSGIVIVAFTALNNDGDVRKHLADHMFDGYSQKGQPPNNLVALNRVN